MFNSSNLFNQIENSSLFKKQSTRVVIKKQQTIVEQEELDNTTRIEKLFNIASFNEKDAKADLRSSAGLRNSKGRKIDLDDPVLNYLNELHILIGTDLERRKGIETKRGN
jgi:hypothetical protein